MVDAGRHKINCWVPESLWEKVEALGYDSPTKATIAGYEALIGKEDAQEEKKDLGNNWEKMGNNWENVGKQLEEAQRQIKDMEESLRKAPDLAEFARLQARSEELEKAERDKEYLKGQIAIKDQQLDKQAFSLQSVIQENSRLNVKLLPENTENKKPWWKFW